MKVESCKKCGDTLKVAHSCSTCQQPNQFECSHCDITLIEQYHTQCNI